MQANHSQISLYFHNIINDVIIMDAADYDFAHIPEFDMKELTLFELTDLQQCGKKRSAEGGTCKRVKKVKMGGPVKIGREEAAKYWQSLIDAGREMSIRRQAAVMFTSPPDQVKLKVQAVKSLAENEAFLAAMQAKVSLFSQTKPKSIPEDLKFSCMHCDKTFTTKTSLGQHTAAKHVKQL